MPEEQPLQCLAPLQLILEAKNILLVVEFEEVEELGTRFHDGEGGRVCVVDDDGDAAVGVEAEEPFFLLVVGHDVAEGERRMLVGLLVWGRGGGVVHEGGVPGGAVDICELLEHNLNFLSVGGAHGDEMKALLTHC